MTIRASFDDGRVMMFGDSYKKWDLQLWEYCEYKISNLPMHIEVSDQPWIGYGGLKWCPWKSFQEELDEEGKERKINDFTFRLPTEKEIRCLVKQFSKKGENTSALPTLES